MASDVTPEELQAGRDYEALFVPALFAPWTDHLLDGAAVSAGTHVLDIACGSGVLARAALERSGKSGRVVGLDPAPGMIGAAREVEPEIEWVLGRAEDLPFTDGTFDCVVSQFGMMFFQDHMQAMREMHRATRPGGKLAVALWHGLDRNPAYEDIVAILADHVSPDAAEAVSVPFSLGDPGQIAGLMSHAGFDDISIETKAAQATFPSTRKMVEVELRGWLPLFDIFLSEEEIADVLVKSDATLSKYAAPSGEAIFATSAYVMTAGKPD